MAARIWRVAIVLTLLMLVCRRDLLAQRPLVTAEVMGPGLPLSLARSDSNNILSIKWGETVTIHFHPVGRCIINPPGMHPISSDTVFVWVPGMTGYPDRRDPIWFTLECSQGHPRSASIILRVP